ncbi:GNAT family N-acetyltransferase [Flavivirga eckloniae]|uniref:N-acetyltransferase n=1 Tax=Flavivirga eckloniae TaxID=1803846 RepID=A0A2K9PWQ5_9FLAO|nr:GNAT family N-acetyltransferase [Flavivirga eckloniae]AUP81484.1 N-acetyltransferase [Flavivirga eckloniae]
MYSTKLIEEENIQSILPLLNKLNPKIEKNVLEERLNDMIKSNYKCVGLYDDEKLIGISGLWILTKYYVGKHIEPDNVYLLPEYQGKGLGKLLINWVLDYGKSNGCVASELNCYLGNTEGHKFWETMGYEKIAYHFAKKL